MSLVDAEEPPIGFSLAYWDGRGLRLVPVQLAVHDARHPEELKVLLLKAYTALCLGIQPMQGIQQPPRIVRRTIGSVLKHHGQDIREELPLPINVPPEPPEAA